MTIKWDTTYQCTSMCAYCINANHLSAGETSVTSTEALRIIKLIRSQLPLDFIQFLGANALQDKDFINILKGLEETSIFFSLQLNASSLTKEYMAFLYTFKNLSYVTLMPEGAYPTVLPIHAPPSLLLQPSVEICPRKSKVKI